MSANRIVNRNVTIRQSDKRKVSHFVVSNVSNVIVPAEIAYSQSMYVFHVILPVTLCFLTAYIIYEFVHNQNNRAKRIMVPVGILAAASCAEIFNYLTKIVSSLSLLSQIGTIIFIVIMGNIMGLNISDMVKMKRENEQLVFDMNLLENSLAEQKKYNTMIAKNEEITKKQRHDLRHQLIVIKELAGNKNPSLTEYLDSLIHSIPHVPKKYCENKAVNSIMYQSLTKLTKTVNCVRLYHAYMKLHKPSPRHP